MQSRAKVFGHAIHPMLIVLPLGLLSVAFLFDLVYYVVDIDGLISAAFFDTLVGIIGGLLAAGFGLWDWAAIPEGTRAKQIGLLHGAGNVVAVLLFLVSWLLRLRTPNHEVNPFGFVLEVIAMGVLLTAAWLGGELVQRLGVGVYPGAHLDAPSSLSEANSLPGAPRSAWQRTLAAMKRWRSAFQAH